MGQCLSKKSTGVEQSNSPGKSKSAVKHEKLNIDNPSNVTGLSLLPPDQKPSDETPKMHGGENFSFKGTIDVVPEYPALDGPSILVAQTPSVVSGAEDSRNPTLSTTGTESDANDGTSTSFGTLDSRNDKSDDVGGKISRDCDDGRNSAEPSKRAIESVHIDEYGRPVYADNALSAPTPSQETPQLIFSPTFSDANPRNKRGAHDDTTQPKALCQEVSVVEGDNCDASSSVINPNHAIIVWDDAVIEERDDAGKNNVALVEASEPKKPDLPKNNLPYLSVAVRDNPADPVAQRRVSEVPDAFQAKNPASASPQQQPEPSVMCHSYISSSSSSGTDDDSSDSSDDSDSSDASTLSGSSSSCSDSSSCSSSSLGSEEVSCRSHESNTKEEGNVTTKKIVVSYGSSATQLHPASPQASNGKQVAVTSSQKKSQFAVSSADAQNQMVTSSSNQLLIPDSPLELQSSHSSRTNLDKPEKQKSSTKRHDNNTAAIRSHPAGSQSTQPSETNLDKEENPKPSPTKKLYHSTTSMGSHPVPTNTTRIPKKNPLPKAFHNRVLSSDFTFSSRKSDKSGTKRNYDVGPPEARFAKQGRRPSAPMPEVFMPEVLNREAKAERRRSSSQPPRRRISEKPKHFTFNGYEASGFSPTNEVHHVPSGGLAAEKSQVTIPVQHSGQEPNKVPSRKIASGKYAEFSDDHNSSSSVLNAVYHSDGDDKKESQISRTAASSVGGKVDSEFIEERENLPYVPNLGHGQQKTLAIGSGRNAFGGGNEDSRDDCDSRPFDEETVDDDERDVTVDQRYSFDTECRDPPAAAASSSSSRRWQAKDESQSVKSDASSLSENVVVRPMNPKFSSCAKTKDGRAQGNINICADTQQHGWFAPTDKVKPIPDRVAGRQADSSSSLGSGYFHERKEKQMQKHVDQDRQMDNRDSAATTKQDIMVEHRQSLSDSDKSQNAMRSNTTAKTTTTRSHLRQHSFERIVSKSANGCQGLSKSSISKRREPSIPKTNLGRNENEVHRSLSMNSDKSKVQKYTQQTSQTRTASISLNDCHKSPGTKTEDSSSKPVCLSTCGAVPSRNDIRCSHAARRLNNIAAQKAEGTHSFNKYGAAFSEKSKNTNCASHTSTTEKGRATTSLLGSNMSPTEKELNATTDCTSDKSKAIASSFSSNNTSTTHEADVTVRADIMMQRLRSLTDKNSPRSSDQMKSLSSSSDGGSLSAVPSHSGNNAADGTIKKTCLLKKHQALNSKEDREKTGALGVPQRRRAQQHLSRSNKFSAESVKVSFTPQNALQADNSKEDQENSGSMPPQRSVSQQHPLVSEEKRTPVSCSEEPTYSITRAMSPSPQRSARQIERARERRRMRNASRGRVR